MHNVTPAGDNWSIAIYETDVDGRPAAACERVIAFVVTIDGDDGSIDMTSSAITRFGSTEECRYEAFAHERTTACSSLSQTSQNVKLHERTWPHEGLGMTWSMNRSVSLRS